MTSTRTRKTKKPINRNKSDEKIKYLIKTTGRGNGGNLLIEIPASWKVTFGYVNPSAKQAGYSDGHCLRVWEGEKLRAVFDSVVSFRDMSIPLATEHKQETGSSTWSSDSEGNFSNASTIKVDKKLIPEAIVVEDGELDL